MQAKVYIALSRLDTSTGRTTAKVAQVASQDVYRVLNELQERGLVEKILAKPTLYKATPMNDGLSLLLQNKKEEFIETEKQIKEISSNFYDDLNENIMEEKAQFSITSKITLLLKMHDKLADAAKKSIDLLYPQNCSKKILFNNCQYIYRAIKRNVQIRAILSKVNEETTVETPNHRLKNPLFQLRYASDTCNLFGMHIFDKQEVTVAVSEKPIPILWTNNVHVVKLAEAYFENTWNNAQIN